MIHAALDPELLFRIDSAEQRKVVGSGNSASQLDPWKNLAKRSLASAETELAVVR